MWFFKTQFWRKWERKEDQLIMLRKRREAEDIAFQVWSCKDLLRHEKTPGKHRAWWDSTRSRYWEQTSGFKSSIRVQSRKSIITSNSTVISTTKSIHKAKLQMYIYYHFYWEETKNIFMHGRRHTMQRLSLVQRVRGSLLFAL